MSVLAMSGARASVYSRKAAEAVNALRHVGGLACGDWVREFLAGGAGRSGKTGLTGSGLLCARSDER